jgi:hypothetical protein
MSDNAKLRRWLELIPGRPRVDPRERVSERSVSTRTNIDSDYYDHFTP